MIVLFFKQKTAYEMRISDWSSDVCSSDLTDDLRGSMSLHVIERLRESGKCAEIRLYDSVVARRELEELADDLTVYDDFYEGCSNADLVIIANNHPVFSKIEFNKVVNKMNDGGFAIGRASCRERVCKYV